MPSGAHRRLDAPACGEVVYEFADFRLDPRRLLLSSISTGATIALTSKSLQLLVLLVERRGELVLKNDLMQAIWPRVIVEENNLERHISMLRKALGETAGDNRYIVTLAGRGYRFVAPVREVAETAAVADTPSQVRSGPAWGAGKIARWRIGVIAGTGVLLLALVVALFHYSSEKRTIVAGSVGAVTPAPSLAVLPFDNLTGNAANEFLAAGLAEELIHRLTISSGLQVSSRAASFAYKSRRKDVRTLTRELNVSHLLEGSLRQNGDRLRVTVQLVDAATGFHVWSQSFERALGDVLALQDELSAAIVQRLTPGAQAAGTGAPDAGSSTKDVHAWLLFLEANSLVGISQANLVRARQLYDQAIALDGTFARALAARSNTLQLLASLGVEPFDLMAQAESDARRALELDPALPDALVAVAAADMARGSWESAKLGFEKAHALMPRSPHPLNHLVLLQSVGHLDEALSLVVESRKLAPLALPPIMAQSTLEWMRGNAAEAQRLLEIGIRLGAPVDVGAGGLLQAQLAAAAGRPEEAARILMLQMQPSAAKAGAERVLTAVYAASRDSRQRSAAAAALRDLVARVPLESLERRHGTTLMMLHAMVGDLDSAYQAANGAADFYERYGSVGVHWGALWMPPMADFRRDPRFAAFVKRLRLPEFWALHGGPEACEPRGEAVICGPRALTTSFQ